LSSVAVSRFHLNEHERRHHCHYGIWGPGLRSSPLCSRTRNVLGFVICPVRGGGGGQVLGARPFDSPAKCATCFFGGAIPQLPWNFHIAEAALRNGRTWWGERQWKAVKVGGDNTACELLSAIRPRCPGKDMAHSAGPVSRAFPQNTGFRFPTFPTLSIFNPDSGHINTHRSIYIYIYIVVDVHEQLATSPGAGFHCVSAGVS